MIIDKVGSLDPSSFVVGKLDTVAAVVKGQLSALFEVEEVGLTSLADTLHVTAALDHVSVAAKGLMGRFKRWEGALKALAAGFEGRTYVAMREVLAAAGLTGPLEEVANAVKGVILYLVKHGVFEAVEDYAQVGGVGIVREVAAVQPITLVPTLPPTPAA